MSVIPDIRSLEQARAYAARTPCAGCGKEGTLSAFETRKPGPNESRLFLKCRHCGRFDWLTAPARLDLNDPAPGSLMEQSRVILLDEEKGWTADLRPIVLSYQYVRGLIDQVGIEASRFAEHADELLRLAPTAELRVRVLGWQD